MDSSNVSRSSFRIVRDAKIFARCTALSEMRSAMSSPNCPIMHKTALLKIVTTVDVTRKLASTNRSAEGASERLSASFGPVSVALDVLVRRRRIISRSSSSSRLVFSSIAWSSFLSCVVDS